MASLELIAARGTNSRGPVSCGSKPIARA